MKLIENIGSKSWVNKSGRKDSATFGLFECPTCMKYVEKPVRKGLIAKSCGGKVCRKATFTSGNLTKRKTNLKETSSLSKEVTALRVMYRKTVRGTPKDVWGSAKEFSTAMELPYATARCDNAGVRLTLTTNSEGESVFSKERSTRYYTDFSKNILNTKYLLDKYEINGSAAGNIVRTHVTNSKAPEFATLTKTVIGGIISYALTEVQYTLFESAINSYLCRNTPTRIYLMQNADAFKIGITNDVEVRLKSIHAAGSFNTKVIHEVYIGKEAITLERRLHKEFKRVQIMYEWFKLTPEDVVRVKASMSSSLAENEYLVEEASRKVKNKLVNIANTKKEYQEALVAEKELRLSAEKPTVKTVGRTVYKQPVKAYSQLHHNLYARAKVFAGGVKGLAEDRNTPTKFCELMDEKIELAVVKFGTRRLTMKADWVILPTSEAMSEVRAKGVNQYTIEGGLVATHVSANVAALVVGGSRSHIGSCCAGKRKTHKGFRWEFS